MEKISILVSTRNPGKLSQIQAIMSLPVVSLAEAGIEGDVAETGKTLQENALLKARFAAEKSAPFMKTWCLGEDTGLYIDALDGKPGIYPARWAGEGVSGDALRDFTLQQMANVPEGRRTATFKACVVAISPDGKEYVFEGELAGKLLTEARGEISPGLPYSSIFVPDGYEKTLNDIDSDFLKTSTHRAKAFAAAAAFIESRL